MRTTISAFVILAAAGSAMGQTYIPFGVSTGTLGVNYNTSSEVPTNQHYYRAQNSQTNTNGATFDFDNTNDLDPGAGFLSMRNIFQVLPGQFGLDLVLTAPTSLGGAIPTLTAVDNVDGSVANASNAGVVSWAVNNYLTGPSNPANGNVNSLFRSNNADPATLSFSNLNVIPGGFTVDVSGFLNTDGTIYWYNPSTPNSSIASFFSGGGLFASGRIKFDGTLTYITANDSTSGVDFYDGTIAYSLELIPSPSAAGLLGLGGLIAARRRRA